MKNSEIIILAQTLGYFRAKKDETRQAVLSELAEVEGFEDEEFMAAAIKVLNAESDRRAKVAAKRARDKVERDQEAENKPVSSGVDSATAHIDELPSGLYVVTTAQNNTDIDSVFFESLRQYCRHNGAQLLIAKSTYNKNGFQSVECFADGIHYDSKVVPYIVENQTRLGGKIDFCAQANVLPTAKNPLSGFEAITAPGIDVIIPAVKISLKCTAALKNGMRGKILYSTGATTKRNYITRKAGAVAASEHNIGALVVDTRADGPAIVRQLEQMADFVGFYDKGLYYSPEGVYKAKTSYTEAIQFGDIHAEKMTPENLSKILGLLAVWNPRTAILHDVMDFSSRNHHNVKDCAFMFAQHTAGNTVAGDIVTTSEVIDAITCAGAEWGMATHIIESNHDLAINTWLKNADFKLDPVNALTYLQCMTALYTYIADTGKGDFNMLEFAYKHIGKGQSDIGENLIFHETDESVIMAGVEMGNHGHTGINGSRGSPAQFRTMGIPMNTGHTHTPSITGACYTAGVAGSLEMGYNIGPSSWQLANIVTYENGQRQIIFM